VAGNWRNAQDILKIGLIRFKVPEAGEFAPPASQEHATRQTTVVS
jgi:hypothetical protein